MEYEHFGPTLKVSEELHAGKYRQEGETFYDAMARIAAALSDNDIHRRKFKNILLNMRFIPAGRVQAASGSAKKVTAYNCFVSQTIKDSFNGIMDAAVEGGQTMRMGGGIGYDFSTLRPRGDLITTLGSRSSGPVSFMDIFNSVCGTIASAGHRRGAQMGIMRVDHPDIMEFVRAKQNSNRLTNFNISVGVTDEFMQAVQNKTDFDLRFKGKTYSKINAFNLWEDIMRSTYDWAEPGVVFIDTMNSMNNLWYCETIAATNPCSEQPLPPYGACLLGSFNLTRYIATNNVDMRMFNWPQYHLDIEEVVRAMDNVVDRTIYPLKKQEDEAKSKRRMGLGIMGLANAGEALGYPYGSPGFVEFENDILKALNRYSYLASAQIASEKGSFPLFDKERFLQSKYVQTLDADVKEAILEKGIRNSHLTSIAPTGTISLTADNVSGGIEPVFAHTVERTIIEFDGPVIERIVDYGLAKFGLRGKTTKDVTIKEHLDVLITASRNVDSAVSKTVNLPQDTKWDDFKDIYYTAWINGCKGVSTYRVGGKRSGILNAAEENEGSACYIDPETGVKSCDT